MPMPDTRVRVAILDTHENFSAEYARRLRRSPRIEILGTLASGADLERLVAQHCVDVTLLDTTAPASPSSPTHYPLLRAIPRLINAHPSLAIMVVSLYAERTLAKAVIGLGARAFLLKDDGAALDDLAGLVLAVHAGRRYVSPIPPHGLVEGVSPRRVR